MGKVSTLSVGPGSGLYNAFNSIKSDHPLITSVTSENNRVNINIDNSNVLFSFGSADGTYIKPWSYTYAGSTTDPGNAGYIYCNASNPVTIIVASSSDIFFLKIKSVGTSGNNTGLTAAYCKNNSDHYFGITINNPKATSIESLDLKTEDNAVYKIRKILDYTVEASHIDYVDYSILCSGTQPQYKFASIISCTTVTFDSTITFGGNNYYSLGNNTLIKMD